MNIEAECGFPHMYFGHASYSFSSAEKIICAYAVKGMWQLAELEIASRKLTPIETGYAEVTFVRASKDRAVFRGGSPTEPVSIVEVNLQSKNAT